MPLANARIDDPFGAFTDEVVRLEGAPAGPLRGLTFGAKDLYDVAGHVTRAGSPAWGATHGAASETAPAVAALLSAGADLVGKTHTDELAWSLLGQNAHYGTPTNPRNPERVPGGSSSGSVVAVAGELVDFAVGSDTGGSVRVPASNCGVYGLRTTHGAISLAGVVPLAPGFDTVGWFAREPDVLDRVAQVLLDEQEAAPSFQRCVVATDAFDVVDARLASALQPCAEFLGTRCGAASVAAIADGGLRGWADAWRTIQAREVWAAHGEWVQAENPEFGPGIRERFDWAKSLDGAAEEGARAVRRAADAQLRLVLADETALLVPAAPSVAPLLDATADELETYRTSAMMLTCAAGLAGLPQISIPAGVLDGCPVGLGVLGPPGSDRALIALAAAWASDSAT